MLFKYLVFKKSLQRSTIKHLECFKGQLCVKIYRPLPHFWHSWFFLKCSWFFAPTCGDLWSVSKFEYSIAYVWMCYGKVVKARKINNSTNKPANIRTQSGWERAYFVARNILRCHYFILSIPATMVIWSKVHLIFL